MFHRRIWWLVSGSRPGKKKPKKGPKRKVHEFSPAFVNSGDVFPWENKHDSHRTFVPECPREKFMNWPLFGLVCRGDSWLEHRCVWKRQSSPKFAAIDFLRDNFRGFTELPWLCFRAPSHRFPTRSTRQNAKRFFFVGGGGGEGSKLRDAYHPRRNYPKFHAFFAKLML